MTTVAATRGSVTARTRATIAYEASASNARVGCALPRVARARVRDRVRADLESLVAQVVQRLPVDQGRLEASLGDQPCRVLSDETRDNEKYRRKAGSLEHGRSVGGSVSKSIVEGQHDRPRRK